MEKTKKIDLSGRPNEEKNVDPNCPTWIFANEESADNDLKNKFEIKDEEEVKSNK